MNKEQTRLTLRRKLSGLKTTFTAFALILLGAAGFDLTSATLINKDLSGDFSLVTTAQAGSVYYNFTNGNLTLKLDPNVPASLDILDTRND